MEGNWIEGINVPQHCLIAINVLTSCCDECSQYGVSAPVCMEPGIDPTYLYPNWPYCLGGSNSWALPVHSFLRFSFFHMVSRVIQYVKGHKKFLRYWKHLQNHNTYSLMVHAYSSQISTQYYYLLSMYCNRILPCSAGLYTSWFLQ